MRIDAAHPHTFTEWLGNCFLLHKDVTVLLAVGSQVAWKDTCTQLWAEESYQKSISKRLHRVYATFSKLAIVESFYRSEILQY